MEQEQNRRTGLTDSPNSSLNRKRQASFERSPSLPVAVLPSKRRRIADKSDLEARERGDDEFDVAKSRDFPEEAPLRPQSPSLLELIRTASHGNRLRVREHKGDLFDAPPNALLIHSCNSQAVWGAGIAKAFKKNYPDAFASYNDHCNLRTYRRSLIGRAYLIPPSSRNTKGHFIGCLFVSLHFGQLKSSPEAIHENTKLSMQDLLRQVRDWNRRIRLAQNNSMQDSDDKDEDKNKDSNVEIDKADPVGISADISNSCNDRRIRHVRMCRINSGLFKVPWPWTKELLESLSVDEHDEDGVKEIHVYSLD